MHLYYGVNTHSNRGIYEEPAFLNQSSLAGAVPTGVPTLLEGALGFKFEDACFVLNTRFKLDALTPPPSEAWWYASIISAHRRPKEVA